MHYQDAHPSTSVQYDDVILKAELKRFGFNPGPIVDSTRHLYIKKLENLKEEFQSVNKLTCKSLKANFKQQKGCTCSTSSATTPMTELKSLEINAKPIEDSSKTDSTKTLYTDNPEELKKGCTCTCDCEDKSSRSRKHTSLETVLNPEPRMDNTRSISMEELQKGAQCVNVDKLCHPRKVNINLPKECATSLPSATIVAIYLTKNDCNTEPVVNSTINLCMADPGELREGFKPDNVDKPSAPLKSNVNQSKACTCSTPSTTTPMAEQRSSELNTELITDSTKNLEAPKKGFKNDNVNRSSRCTSTLSIDTLVAELRTFGYNPGPIVDSTKSLYIRKLEQLKQGIKCDEKKLGRSMKAKTTINQSKTRTTSRLRPTIPTKFACNPETIEDSTNNTYNDLERFKKGTKCDNVDQSSTPRKTLNVEQSKECTCSNPSTITPIAEHSKLSPEPIVHNTRSRLMKGLEELKKGLKCDNTDKLSRPLKTSKANAKQSTKISCRGQIEKYLLNTDWTRDLRRFIRLEKEVQQEFTDASKEWSSGNAKKSLTYLLLDPRITKNLPVKTTKSNKNSQWTTFIDSIFYVGTGENEGPYKHLAEAKAFWEKNMPSEDKKIQYILDIWKDNMGVICLQVFHNLIPVEAYTYEAAMIDALGLKKLTNLTSGSSKGIVESWTEKKRSMLGVHLLYKAMERYNFKEGERQLRPNDL